MTEYRAKRLETAPAIDADWDKPAWAGINATVVGEFMGDRPNHLPKTEVKTAYDDDAIYVIFRVEDQYVRAVAKGYQDTVCFDSCVEFFFAPGELAGGYFNLETNCGGTILMHYQTAPDVDRAEVASDRLDQIEIATTQPRLIDPEIEEPTIWTLEYRMPLCVLDGYCEIAKPAPGVTWRNNFFKCGDNTSHPHWLTWAKVEHPTPRFHLPEYFGTLLFE